MSMDCSTDYKVKPALWRDVIKANSFQPYDQYVAALNIKNSKVNSNFFTKRGTGVSISNKIIKQTLPKNEDYPCPKIRHYSVTGNPTCITGSFSRKVTEVSTYGIDMLDATGSVNDANI